jgi:hypothetical protein
LEKPQKITFAATKNKILRELNCSEHRAARMASRMVDEYNIKLNKIKTHEKEERDPEFAAFMAMIREGIGK